MAKRKKPKKPCFRPLWQQWTTPVLSAVLFFLCLPGLASCGVLKQLQDQEIREKDIAIVTQGVQDVKRKLDSGEDPLTKYSGIAAILLTAITGLVSNHKQNTTSAQTMAAQEQAKAAQEAAKVAQKHIDEVYDATHAPRVVLATVAAPSAPAA